MDLRDLPDDMVIYKYVADTLHSWANQFPISNDEVDAYAFTYRLHYLSNANLFSSPLAYLGLEEQYVNLGSAWYIVNTYISPSYRSKVITGILVKTEYLDDKGLKNYSNKKLRIGAGFDPVSVNVDDDGGEIWVDYSLEINNNKSGENDFYLNIREAGKIKKDESGFFVTAGIL